MVTKNSDQPPMRARVLLGIPRRRLVRFRVGVGVSPKIISAGSDDAIRIELARDGTYIVEFR